MLTRARANRATVPLHNRYMVVGNDRSFASLNDVVSFHQRHPVTDDGDTLLIPCPIQGQRDDLAELE
jgi:hypothetical protein